MDSYTHNPDSQNTQSYQKSLYFNVLADIDSFIGTQFYRACPNPNCKKGVENQGSEDAPEYYCSKCDTKSPHYIPYYKGRVVLRDHSDALVCSFFKEEIGDEILGCCPRRLDAFGDEERAQFLKMKEGEDCFMLLIRAKLDFYFKEARIGYTIFDVERERLVYPDVNRVLIGQLERILG